MCAMRRVRLTKRQIIQQVKSLKPCYCEIVEDEPFFNRLLRRLIKCKTFREIKQIIQHDLQDFNQDNCLLYATAPISCLNFEAHLSPTFKKREEKRKLLQDYLDEDLDNDHYGPQHDEDFTAFMPIDYQV